MRFLFIIIFSFVALTNLNAQAIELDSLTNEQDHEIFINPEVLPEFPGGYDSLYSFIEYHYNWSAGHDTISGKVFVEFMVEKDGSVTNVKVIRGLNESCDEEAKRLVSILPKFNPGEQSGIPVRMKMVLPIIFGG